MKNTLSRTLIALILSLVIIASMGLSLVASAAETVKDCPMIEVPGFMSTTLYIDKDHPENGEAWPPSGDAILGAVKEALPAFFSFFITHNYDKLADSVDPVVYELFEPAMLDENGDPKGNSGVNWEYPAAETVTASSTLTFRYDWRLSPLEIAGELNDFIEYVLDASGCDKVTITAHSFGGMVTLAYFKLFGTDDVKSVVFNTTAVFGETYTGELLSGQITLDGDAITEYMKYAFQGNENEELLVGLFEFLNKTGVLDAVCLLGNRLTEGLTPKTIPDVVAPLFAGWLAIWSMVPDDMAEECEDYIFNNVYADRQTEYAGLKAKVERIDTELRDCKTETLNAVNDNVEMYIISRYGYSSLPITPSYTNLGDGNIDTKFSSFGATTSLYGERLSDSYLEGKDPAYISPDRQVDASTCMFPEQTWIIRNLQHGPNPGPLNEMMETMLYSGSQMTVDTLEGYDRYMYYDNTANTLSSVYPDTVPAGYIPTFIEKLSARFVAMTSSFIC